MNVKPRSKVLEDIIREAKKYPDGWKAVLGKDYMRLSSDYYIFHPEVGLYLLKEYGKNPYALKGVGGKIARHIDEDIITSISDYSGNFGVIQGDIRKIISNIERGITPHKILSAALEGKDMGLSIPLRGKASSEEKNYQQMREIISSKQKKIDREFEKLAENEGLYRSYDWDKYWSTL